MEPVAHRRAGEAVARMDTRTTLLEVARLHGEIAYLEAKLARTRAALAESNQRIARL
jgi:uncharacterized small protein (DUF1192 family)